MGKGCDLFADLAVVVCQIQADQDSDQVRKQLFVIRILLAEVAVGVVARRITP